MPVNFQMRPTVRSFQIRIRLASRTYSELRVIEAAQENKVDKSQPINIVLQPYLNQYLNRRVVYFSYTYSVRQVFGITYSPANEFPVFLTGSITSSKAWFKRM